MREAAKNSYWSSKSRASSWTGRRAHLEDLVIKFKKRGRALAFVRFHHNRDEARWLEECWVILQSCIRCALGKMLWRRQRRAASLLNLVAESSSSHKVRQAA